MFRGKQTSAALTAWYKTAEKYYNFRWEMALLEPQENYWLELICASSLTSNLEDIIWTAALEHMALFCHGILQQECHWDFLNQAECKQAKGKQFYTHPDNALMTKWFEPETSDWTKVFEGD